MAGDGSGTGRPPKLEGIVPVPDTIARRAWECAFELGAEHSNFIGEPLLWHWLIGRAMRGPDALTWGECFVLCRLRAVYYEKGAA